MDKNLSKEDLFIKEKFVDANIQEYEIIGGDCIVVLLDTRQDE
jgi:hypothetical protein